VGKNESTQRSATASLVERLISRIETKLSDNDTKLSIADYIRLLQWKRELDGEEVPNKVEVQWVDFVDEDAKSKEESVHKT
jgi:hypothetical protein